MENDTANIWQKFGDKLRLFILSRVNNTEVAEDILQEVFLKIHSNIDSLRETSKIQAWIYQIARNTINDYYRKTKHQYCAEEFEIGEDEEIKNDSMNKIAEGLHEFMNELPIKYCEALCKTELDGVSQVEYANEIGISNSGAKSRVQRGRAMIKDMLMKCCHFQFDKYGTIVDYHPVTCCCCHQYFEDNPDEGADN